MEKKEKKQRPVAAEKKQHAEKALHAEKPAMEKKRVKKGKAFLKLRRLISRKKLPSFRGRFGKMQFRRPSIEKWQKWRKPRGKSTLKKTQEDGARPNSGYRTRKEIRFLHPSGFKEVLVHNAAELSGLQDCIVKIAAAVGKKKRKQIVAEAKKTGLRLAN